MRWTRQARRWALGVAAPGLFSAASGFEVSNLGVFALAGMRYGASMLWAVAVSLLVASLLQQMAAVVGLGLRGGLLEEAGRRSRWLSASLAWSLYTANTATATMNMAGLAYMLSVFLGVDWRLGLSLVLLSLWSLSYSARSYRGAERMLVALSALLLVFVAAALLLSPLSPAEVARGLVVRRMSGEEALFVVAVFGASAAPYSLVLQAEATAADRGRSGEAEIAGVAAGTLFALIIGFSVVLAAPAMAGSCSSMACLVDPGVVGAPVAAAIMVGVMASGTLALMAIILVNAALMGAPLDRAVGAPGYFVSSGLTLGTSYMAALAMLSAWSLDMVVEAASVVVSMTAWVPALAVYLLYRGRIGGAASALGAFAVASSAAVNLLALAGA